MLVGIVGRIGSGKDTIADMMNEMSIKDSPVVKLSLCERIFTGSLGRMCVGKDDVHHVQTGRFKVIKFADKLKDVVCLLVGCTREQMEDRVFKEKPLGGWWFVYTDAGGNIISERDYLKLDACGRSSYTRKDLSIRSLMQVIGTECFRVKVHPDTWVMLTMDEVKRTNGDVIITDVRFPNEMDIIKANGGIIIKVSRNMGQVSNHESELYIDSCDCHDYFIDNNGSIDDLRWKVRKIYDSVKNQ